MLPVEVKSEYPIICLKHYVGLDYSISKELQKYEIGKNTIKRVVDSQALENFFQKYINNPVFLKKYQNSDSLIQFNEENVKKLLSHENFKKDLEASIKSVFENSKKDLEKLDLLTENPLLTKITLLGIEIPDENNTKKEGFTNKKISSGDSPEIKESHIILGIISPENLLHEYLHTLPIKKQNEVKETFISLLNNIIELFGLNKIFDIEKIISAEDFIGKTNQIFDQIIEKIENSDKEKVLFEEFLKKIFKNENINQVKSLIPHNAIRKGTNEEFFINLFKDKTAEKLTPFLSENGKRELKKYEIKKEIQIARESVKNYPEDQKNEEMRSRLFEIIFKLEKDKNLLKDLHTNEISESKKEILNNLNTIKEKSTSVKQN